MTLAQDTGNNKARRQLKALLKNTNGSGHLSGAIQTVTKEAY